MYTGTMQTAVYFPRSSIRQSSSRAVRTVVASRACFQLRADASHFVILTACFIDCHSVLSTYRTVRYPAFCTVVVPARLEGLYGRALGSRYAYSYEYGSY